MGVAALPLPVWWYTGGGTLLTRALTGVVVDGDGLVVVVDGEGVAVAVAVGVGVGVAVGLGVLVAVRVVPFTVFAPGVIVDPVQVPEEVKGWSKVMSK
jgi:hypothetical protein